MGCHRHVAQTKGFALFHQPAATSTGAHNYSSHATGRAGGMSSMNTFSSALFRAVVAAGAPVAIFWALDSRLNPEQGPDIGGGFFMLLALFAIPLVWAWFDGRRHVLRSTLTVWIVAAALVSLAGVVRFMTSGGFSVADTGESIFLAVFLAMPFLAGGCVGALLGGATSHRRA